MTSEEKRAFANEAERVLDHPLVREVMQEFALNMGFTLDGFPRYGLSKVAKYAATVARAQALGIDPDALRCTPSEANAEILRKAEIVAAAGKPVIVVEVPDAE